MVKTGCLAGIGVLVAFCAQTWQEHTPLPDPLAGGYALPYRKGVIYAGGSTWRNGVKEFRADVHLYDMSSDHWSRIPSLPLPLAYGAAVTTSKGIEILGGASTSRVSRQSLRLQVATGTWLVSGQLPGDTLLARAEAIRDEVYLIGGCSDLADLTGCSDAVWMRDPAGKWNRIGNLPDGARAVAATAVLGNHIFLFGGCSGPRKDMVINHDDAWRFDTRKREWKKLRSLPKSNRGLAAIALDDNRILLTGGYVASHEEAEGKPPEFGFTADTLIYEADTDRYIATSSLPISAAGMALVHSGRGILAIGGEDRMKGRSPRVFAFRD